MARRYLDRKTKDRFKRLSRFDETPRRITETGPKIPEFEDAINAKRMVYLRDVGGESQSASELLNERIDELLNAAEETSEYIKHVNTHLDKQKLRINELKKLQKVFESQVSTLESNDKK